jgi:hypothetical protein
MAEQLGYLSRELAEEIAPLLDEGKMALGQSHRLPAAKEADPASG